MTQQSMKGLFKGLRFISQVFDEKEDDEIQIGFPTDVKHVAHIGCDDSSSKPPDWMNGFKQPSEGPGSGDANSAPIPSNTQDTTATKAESPTAARASKSRKSKQSKQSPSLSSDSIDSTTSSKHRRAKTPSLDSGCQEQTDQERVTNSSVGSEPNNGEEIAKVPRKTNKKKTKDGSNEGASKGGSKTRRGKTKTDSNTTEMQPRSKTQEGDESK